MQYLLPYSIVVGQSTDLNTTVKEKNLFDPINHVLKYRRRNGVGGEFTDSSKDNSKQWRMPY